MLKIKNRQLEIMLYLNQHKKSTISELAGEFEVSKRTIMRDLDFLSSIGVPLYTQPGHGGGVCLDQHYSFDQSFFSPHEISNLILALHIADSLNMGHNKNSILKKLELLLPELTLSKENDFFQYVRVAPLAKGFDFNDPLIKSINYGLDEEVLLKLIYDNKEYIIAPLYYSIDSDGISLCGSTDQNCHFFNINKITECTPTDTEFIRDDYKKYMDF